MENEKARSNPRWRVGLTIHFPFSILHFLEDFVMRPRIVAGNWKMHTDRASAQQLALDVVRGVKDNGVRVVLCPPFPYLCVVGEVIAGSRVELGAQNCSDRAEGAFTGEVSPYMLRDVGCSSVILGHSERRHILGELDSQIGAKVHCARKAGLQVILCVGETEKERESGQTFAVLERHLLTGLAGLDRSLLNGIILAYEPVWAIGTGKTATPEIAQEAHAFLRKKLGEIGGESLPILYGGSVKPENAKALFSQPDIDGGLIGGASLKADQFLTIVGSC
jgi:triosephosphate isomerase (TIM)